MLRALAGDAIELTYGHRQLTVYRPLRPTIERDEVLHGALAEGALPDDIAAMIVLNSTGKDLGGRSAEAIDQHQQRPVIGSAGCRVIEHLDATGGVFELHNRALIDEQPGQCCGLWQEAAAIAAQVEYQSVDTAFFGQFIEQPFDVASGAAIVLVTLALRLYVLIEARHTDHAHTDIAPVTLHDALVLLGRLRFQRDFTARELDDLFRRTGRCPARQHLQPY